MGWRNRNREEKKKERKKQIVVISAIMIFVIFVVAVLWNQSYTVEKAIEKSSKGREELRCEEMIYQRELKDGRELIVYGNPKGEICSAVVKKTMAFYKTEHMLGGLRDMPVGDKKVKMERVSYDQYRFYLIGILTDDAAFGVCYGDQMMDLVEYGGTRVVIAVEEELTWNPQYYSKGFEVLDREGNVLESEPKRMPR